MKTLKQFIAILIFCLCVGAASATAQTNEFTYQGKLTDSVMPPSPTYDFEFRLCASETADCTMSPGLLETKQRSGVSVSNGQFTVKLDFNEAHFTGADRFLLISVRRNSGESWTPLSPRQKITSSPYAIKSKNAENAVNATNATNATTAQNALQLGGVTANEYVTNTSLGNTVIRNQTTQQSSSNFNISGNGTAGGTVSADVVNAETEYMMDGFRILGAPTGTANLYVGFAAGNNTGTGVNNSAFGYFAGELANSGGDNSYFGHFSGRSSIGSGNSFFGSSAGRNNLGGGNNTFVGVSAGFGNTIGSNNTMLGTGADVLNNNLSFATAIGAGATINQNNQIVLGRSGGQDGVAIPGNTQISGDLTVVGLLNANLPAGSSNYIQNSPVQQTAILNISGSETISQTDGSSVAFRARNLSTGLTENLAIDADAVSGPPGIGTGGRFSGGAIGVGGLGIGGSNTGTTYGVVGEASGSAGTRVGVGGFSSASSGVSENYGVSGIATGNAGTNIGVYGSATGGIVGVTTNWAGYFVGNTHIAGNLGIGTIGTPTMPQQQLSVGAGMNIDQTDSNNGSVANTLRFGSNSGEAIGSRRMTGANQFGLDFYTNSQNRMSITLGGNVGIGTTAPTERLHVAGNLLIYPTSGNGILSFRNRTDNNLSQVVFADDADVFRGYIGYIGVNAGLGARNDTVEFGTNGKDLTLQTNVTEVMRLKTSGNVGIGTSAPNDKLHVNGIIRISTLGSAGGAPLCWNGFQQISNCSSSLRYKTNIAPFSFGLSFINQLRPITFDWKQGGSRDVGFGAEDVAKINPLFVTYNEKGEVEGVKYDRLSVAFVNAFREQQAQIEEQQKQNQEQKKQIENQQQQIDALKKLVCESKPEAAICKEEQK